MGRYHQYKFIVDGEWRHDETQPFMPDPLGNVNNWLFVRRPEGASSGCAPVPWLTAHHLQCTLPWCVQAITCAISSARCPRRVIEPSSWLHEATA